MKSFRFQRGDLHSGTYGGVAPNPLNSLAHVISALKGKDGRIAIPVFYDRGRRPAAVQLKRWERQQSTLRRSSDSRNPPRWRARLNTRRSCASGFHRPTYMASLAAYRRG